MENQRFLGSEGSVLETKIDQKSIRKWSRKKKAFCDGFLEDFAPFWSPSWDQKSIKNRSKKCIEKMMEKKASWRPNPAAPGAAWRNARGLGGTIGGVQKRQKLEDIGRYWKRIVRTAKFDTPSWPWEVAGGLPPPRGITAARPPFLPLRLEAWACLRGVLGRLGGV